MSGQHTQGRLIVRHEWLIPEGQASRPIGGSVDKDKDRNHYANIVATVSHKYHDNAANLRRLAACWNACDGITTENLENNQSVKWLAQRYNAARTLLADAIETFDENPNEDHEIADRIRAHLHGGAT
jgi:hypothetical protein